MPQPYTDMLSVHDIFNLLSFLTFLTDFSAICQGIGSLSDGLGAQNKGKNIVI